MEECNYCGCKFEVRFDDSDDGLFYCPSCGEDLWEDEDDDLDEEDNYGDEDEE